MWPSPGRRLSVAHERALPDLGRLVVVVGTGLCEESLEPQCRKLRPRDSKGLQAVGGSVLENLDQAPPGPEFHGNLHRPVRAVDRPLQELHPELQVPLLLLQQLKRREIAQGGGSRSRTRSLVRLLWAEALWCRGGVSRRS